MDMERAAFAARKYFNFRTVIPYHYRGLPKLAQDAVPLRMGLPPGIELVEPEVMQPIRFATQGEPRPYAPNQPPQSAAGNDKLRAV